MTVVTATPSARRITDRAQLECLTSSARQEILSALETAGPSTVADVARLLGRPADGLYHHIRALRAVGLVVEVGTVRCGKRPGAQYDVAFRPLRVRHDLESESGRDVARRIGAAVLRSASGDVDACFAGGQGTLEGSGRDLRVGRLTGWLSSEDLVELNSLVDRAFELMRQGPEAGRSLKALSVSMAPLEVAELYRKGGEKG